MCHEIDDLECAHFFFCTRISEANSHEKDWNYYPIKIGTINQHWYVVNGRKRYHRCNMLCKYTEANNKYRKDYDKNKESLYIKFWHISNFYDWGMWQKLPIGSFRWVGKVFQFKEDFIKNYNEDVILDIFLKLMFSVLKNYIKFASSFHIYMKEYKMESLKSI